MYAVLGCGQRLDLLHATFAIPELGHLQPAQSVLSYVIRATQVAGHPSPVRQMHLNVAYVMLVLGLQLLGPRRFFSAVRAQLERGPQL